MSKITKSLIDKLVPHASKDRFAWDGELRGFGVRMKPSGSASFLIQYRNENGATRRMVVGSVGTLTPEDARKIARAQLSEAEKGGDPSNKKREKRTALKVADLCRDYLEAARAGLVLTRFRESKAQSTIVNDEGRIARHIIPLIGRKIAQDVTRADVQRMSDSIAAGKTAGVFKTGLRGKAVVEGGAATAARTVELLGGIWTWAERRGFVSGQNPAKGVDKHRGKPKNRVLTRAELVKLGQSLKSCETKWPLACAALRLIALTGLRREEACGLRWSEIDFAGSCLRLEKTKTGRSTRPLSKAAIEHLRALPRLHDDWVFPNRAGTGSFEAKKVIAEIFDAAGLADARSHDLRRTFATNAAELGYGDGTIGELLGHAARGVTATHYIRRPDAALIAAATATANVIQGALNGVEAQVIPIRQAGGNA